MTASGELIRYEWSQASGGFAERVSQQRFSDGDE